MTLFKFPCEHPTCEPAAHRPYARARGRNWRPSITDLADIDVSDMADGMAFKAAQIASEFALTHGIQQLADGVPFDDVLRKANIVHKAKWDTDAKLGSLCHEAAERFAEDQDYDIPEDLWPNDADRLEQFIIGLRKWWEHRQPDVFASEFIVSRDDPRYIGTGDLIAAIGGELTIVDFKTKREIKDDRSTHFAKWCKQLTMLGLATHIEHFHGTERIGALPWLSTNLPRPRRGLILCIESDGTWREYETPIDPDNLDRLIRPLVDVRTWRPDMKQVSR